MYELESQQIKLCTTPNHRMYIKKRGHKNYELEFAENVFGKSVQYKKDAEYVPENAMEKFVLPQFESFPEKVIDLEVWLQFFGISIMSGHCTDFSINFNIIFEDKTKTILETIIPKLLLENVTKKDEFQWKIYDEQLLHYIKNCLENEELPNWVWNLRSEHCQLLLDSIIKPVSIGNVLKSSMSCYTRNIKLANEIVKLSLHAGWSGNHSIRRNKDGTEYNVIKIMKTRNKPMMNYSNNKNQTERWIEYDGKVYCCTVSSHVFYVRRNGIPCWTGNSSRHG